MAAGAMIDGAELASAEHEGWCGNARASRGWNRRDDDNVHFFVCARHPTNGFGPPFFLGLLDGRCP
jgi:hypothetical protein